MTAENLGKFTFDITMVKYKPEEALTIFTVMGLVVVRAEVMFGGNIEYTGISNLFTKIPVGSVAPWYDIVITKEEGVIAAVEVVKI